LVGRIATRRDREVERLGGGEIEGDGVLVDRPVFWSGEAETARLNRVLVGRGRATFWSGEAERRSGRLRGDRIFILESYF
jgi:hypothetical protein